MRVPTGSGRPAQSNKMQIREVCETHAAAGASKKPPRRHWSLIAFKLAVLIQSDREAVTPGG